MFKLNRNSDSENFDQLEVMMNQLLKQIKHTKKCIPIQNDLYTPMSSYTVKVGTDGNVFRGILFSGVIHKIVIEFQLLDVEIIPSFICSIKRGNTITTETIIPVDGKVNYDLAFPTEDGDIVSISCGGNLNNVYDVYCGLLGNFSIRKNKKR